MLQGLVDAALDHVALAVHNIGVASRLYVETMGARFLFAGDQEDLGFRWAQFRFPGGGKIEFVTPLHAESFLARFLHTRGEGAHHVTLKVPDLSRALEQIRAAGIEPIRISTADPGWKEAFIHPRDASGTLVQLAQANWSDDDMVRHHLQPHGDRDHRHLLLEEVLRPEPLFLLEPGEG